MTHLRSFVAGALGAAWLALFVFRLVQGMDSKAMDNLSDMAFWVFCLGTAALPKKRGWSTRLAQGILGVACLTCLGAYFWFSSPEDRKGLVLGGLGVFALGVVFWLGSLALSRWQMMKRSVPRRMVAASVITIFFAAALIACLYTAGRLMGGVNISDAFGDNLGVTIVVLYLPLALLAWFGYRKWQAMKK